MDGRVRLWNLAEGHIGPEFQAHPTPVSTLGFSDDGRTLSSSSDGDRASRLWDVATGRLLASFDGPASVQSSALAPGGRPSRRRDATGEVHLDPATGSLRLVIPAHDDLVCALAFSPDGETLVCGGFGAIRLYSVGQSTKLNK